MREMPLINLTDEERRRNEYLDKVNHAPYPRIFLIALGILFLFTLAFSLTAF
ncbi:hypothetical protein NIES2098_43070 [Calothrix sp. NIES-2098]|nr:hypothetical protein NIES2098_43070 [Calothrix sp. NIES-2098]